MKCLLDMGNQSNTLQKNKRMNHQIYLFVKKLTEILIKFKVIVGSQYLKLHN